MDLDNARLFLYRVLPWAPLGDPNAYVNIHWTFQGAGFNKPAWGGRACISIDECINSVQWAARMPDTRDFYVCMSTQRDCEESKTGTGRVIRRAYRAQTNVVQLRSLWLDIDVNDGEHKSAKNNPDSVYQNIEEAAAALAQFVKDAGLPRPTIVVGTGSGGLHVYWTMDKALEINIWQPLAQALAEATRRFKLKCDAGVTVDSARVMRLPGTRHSKHKTLAQMYVKAMLSYDYSLEQMRHALAPYMGAQVIPLNPRGNHDNLNAALTAGITGPQTAPINLRTVADAGCGFIRDALDTGGELYPQPLWNLTTLCAVFSDGGRADAHTMSSGYPGYSPEETDELFDRKVREREDKNLGWPSCASVENAGCKACNTCPLKGPNTRPLQFGRPVSVPNAPVAAVLAQNEPDLPHGYSRDANNLVSRVMVAADGTSRLAPVHKVYPLWEGWMQDDPWTLHFKTKIGFTTRNINITLAQASTADGFGRALGMQGMVAYGEEMKGIREFIVNWIGKLQTIKDAVVSSAPFGWSAPNGVVNGFIYAGRVWQNGDDKPAAHPDPVFGAQYNPKGNLAPWTTAASMITDLKSPAHDCIIACAFAAPLVRFTGLQGLLVSCYSTESGVYKTAAMKVAQAVWGSPHTAMQGLTDTANQVLNKIGTLKALPLLWDELKTEQDTAKFVNMTFQLSQGKEKGRLNSDATQRMPGTWQTLLISASNDSILDNVARVTKSTTAGLYRVFEYPVKRVKPHMTASAADQVLLKLNDNYGEAGLAYAQFLGREYDRVHDEVAKCREKIEKAVQAAPDERFWIGSMTVILMGALYANELGLVKIDIPRLYQHLLDTLASMRGEMRSAPSDLGQTVSVSNVLSSYLNQMRARHTLVTNHIITYAGKPRHDTVKVLSDLSKLDALYVHVGKETKLMRVQLASFREWLVDTGYNPVTIVRAMEQTFGAKKMVGRLGSCTPVVTMTETLLQFDLNNPEIAKMGEF